MKKLLLLPLLMITCLSFSQDAKEIIGKPVKIGNLLVAENDFPIGMMWDDANKACRSLGKGSIHLWLFLWLHRHHQFQHQCEARCKRLRNNQNNLN